MRTANSRDGQGPARHEKPMRIAICGAGSAIGAALAARLAPDHDLLYLEPSDPGLPHGTWLPVEGWSAEALTPLLAGAEVFVHAGLYAPETLTDLRGDQAWLDVAGRVSWHLQQAAKEAGVGRLIYLSSLDLVGSYDPAIWVSPEFEPRPEANAESLAFHLLECLAREARQEHHSPVMVARLGHLVHAAEVSNDDYEPLWIDFDDAVTVLAAMVTVDEPRGWRWGGVVHGCADRPDALSRVGMLRKWLGIELQHAFGYVAPAEAEA